MVQPVSCSLADKSAAPARRPLLKTLFLIPSLLFVSALLLIPAVSLLSMSFLTHHPSGTVGAPLTWANYARLFRVGLYLNVLLVTFKVSAVTAISCAIAGFPMAMAIVRGPKWISSLTMTVVLMPLVVSVVVRAFGWQILLANGPNGVVNWVLLQLGLGHFSLHVMYTQTAVIIASLNVYLPMFVLPLAAAISRIDPSIEEAASTLGANAWRVFSRVTLPESMPGMMVGGTLVFSLTATSFVTASLLGGSTGTMLGNLLQQQSITADDWAFSGAIAMLMVALTYFVNGVLVALFERLSSPGRKRAGAAALQGVRA